MCLSSGHTLCVIRMPIDRMLKLNDEKRVEMSTLHRIPDHSQGFNELARPGLSFLWCRHSTGDSMRIPKCVTQRRCGFKSVWEIRRAQLCDQEADDRLP